MSTKYNNQQRVGKSKSQRQFGPKSLRQKPKTKNKNRNTIQNKNNRQSRIGNVSIPLQLSNTVKTYTNLTAKGGSACVPIPPTLLTGQATCIPIHPLFYTGRLSRNALSFTRFSVSSATLYFAPSQGTTETGVVFISGLPNNQEVTQDTTVLQTTLSELGANITPAWMPTKVNVKLNNKMNLLSTTLQDHYPYNFFVTSTTGHTLSAIGNLYLEINYNYSQIGLLNEQVTLVGTSTLWTLSAAGITTTAITTGTTYLIVAISTCVDIDMGELVIIPPNAAINTAVKTEATHNGEAMDYDVNGYHGTLFGLCYVKN